MVMTSPHARAIYSTPHSLNPGGILPLLRDVGAWVRDDGAVHGTLLEIRERVTDGLVYIIYKKKWLHDLVAHGRGLRDEFQIAERRMSLSYLPLLPCRFRT